MRETGNLKSSGRRREDESIGWREVREVKKKRGNRCFKENGE